MEIEHTYIEPEELAKQHLRALQAAGLKFEGKRILDLGCGTGTYTRLMAEQKAALVIGLENVLGNIKLARRAEHTANVHFICGNIEDWGIKGSFDLIFMRGTIYYLKDDLNKIISHIKNLLAPHGELFITFMNSSTRATLINIIKKAASRLPEVIRPAIRTSLAGLYYLLELSSNSANQKKPNWDVIKNKMNTIFYPLTHLTEPVTAKLVLAERGMCVMKVFGGQGQNPKMTDDYGVWAVLGN